MNRFKLSNIIYVSKEQVKNGEINIENNKFVVYLNENFSSISCEGYVALPGFIDRKGEKLYVETGITLLLGGMEGSETRVDTETTYSTDTVGYSSGDASKYRSVYDWLSAQSDKILAFKNLTIHAATIHRLQTGDIQPGFMADLVLFRILDGWQTTSLDAILDGISRFQGNYGRAAAVFQQGALVYCDDAFKRRIQQGNMKHYYSDGVRVSTAKQVSASFSYPGGNQSNHDIHHSLAEKVVFDSISDAIDAFRRGEFLVVVDNEDRENEGDLIIAAEHIDESKTAFMIRYTSGVICVPMTGDILDRLEIPLMVESNQDTFKTAYTVSVDCVDTTTGISARDRACTIRKLVDITSVSTDFQRPGHVFPLRAVEGGVLKRVGHTEAAVDLCLLAGKTPVAAISEIVMDDGTMARRDDLRLFSQTWGLKMISIADLSKFRIDLAQE